MKYGQLAENKKIDTAIYQCFEFICEEDERKFVKKFRQQPHDQSQVLHSFRELILGAFLASNGFEVKHDYAIDNKTPDWSIFDNGDLFKQCPTLGGVLYFEESAGRDIFKYIRNP